MVAIHSFNCICKRTIGHKERQMERQIDRRTDRQIKGWIERQTDREALSLLGRKQYEAHYEKMNKERESERKTDK
jgi:hypothetical protein